VVVLVVCSTRLRPAFFARASADSASRRSRTGSIATLAAAGTLTIAALTLTGTVVPV